jgi:hypothetical protein
MQSHHAGYTKHFLKVALRSDDQALEAAIQTALSGQSPHYPLHMTLATLHLSQDKPGALEHIRSLLSQWQPVELPAQLVLDDDANLYELLGHTHIKFVALCFELNRETLDLARLRVQLCEWLIQRLDTECHARLEVNGRHELEIVAKEARLRVPLVSEECRHHVSLFSSNDLKKHNKALYKEYQCMEAAAFLARLARPPTLTLRLGDIALQ